MSYGIIYKIISKIDGRVYIGQTTTKLARRISKHKSCSKKPKEYIHYAIRKYGFENFEFYPIDSADSKEELDKKETMWISVYNSTVIGIGFNIEKGGNSAGKTSEITRKKLSEAGKGNKNCLGKKFSEESRKRMSEAHKGNPLSEEHKKKVSEAKKGKRFSEEAKKNMSKARIGNKNSVGNKNCLGRKHSEETKKKISETLKNKNRNNSNSVQSEQRSQNPKSDPSPSVEPKK